MIIPKIIISYVIHEEDGTSVAKEFHSSLGKYPPSRQVTLRVSVKGKNSLFFEEIVGIFEQKIKNIKSLVRPVPDIGFDIGSHYLIARENKSAVIIFMSASSRVNSFDWFSRLTSPFSDEKVGVVGCMFSLESLKDSLHEINQTLLKIRLHLHMNSFEIATATARGLNYSNFQINLGVVGNYIAKKLTELVFFKLRKQAPWINNFPRHPNPHLRTTGYAVRANLLFVVLDHFPLQKSDTFNFESGHANISHRITLLGYEVLHCDYKGRYEKYSDLTSPITFRAGNTKSLVSDYEARRYHDLPRSTQRALTRITFEQRN